MWRQRLSTSPAGARAALTLTVVWLLVAGSTARAQTITIGAVPPGTIQTGFQYDTGLMTFLPSARRSADVTVTELGGRGVSSTVHISVYGPDERLLARSEGTLQRGLPVTFSYQITAATPQLLRFSIAVFGIQGRNTQTTVALEDVDADRITIGQRILCSPPADRSGPVTPYCPGVIRNITIGG